MMSVSVKVSRAIPGLFTATGDGAEDKNEVIFVMAPTERLGH